MALFEWTARHNVGHKETDEQHRELAGLVNRLDELTLMKAGREDVGPVLALLVRKSEVHFALEEEAMGKLSYPGAAGHTAEHEKLRAELRRYLAEFRAGGEPLTPEVAVHLKTWLEAHMLMADKAWGNWVRVNTREF